MALMRKPGQSLRPGQKSLAENGTDTQRAEAERHATEELTEQCQQLEEELEELKAKYELYFLGVERMEPARRREEMKRNIARLKTAFTRNTGVRFRVETLYTRYLAYERMWLRAARQREEGTYRRDIFRARRRVRAEAKKQAKADEETLAKAIAPSSVSAAKPLAPVPPVPKAPLTAGLTDTQMRALYDAYVVAKKRCQEDVSKFTYEAMSRSVSKQIPEILTRFQAKAVDFKVVIKDGKALLKVIPKT